MRRIEKLVGKSLAPYTLTVLIAFTLIAAWALVTQPPRFDPGTRTAQELEMMEFNGDIVRAEDGSYLYNPAKRQGLPGPAVVWHKARVELRV